MNLTPPSQVPVLVAAAGAAWETTALDLLARQGSGGTLHKRCVDLSDLVASTATGLARVALVSARLPGDAQRHLDGRCLRARRDRRPGQQLAGADVAGEGGSRRERVPGGDVAVGVRLVGEPDLPAYQPVGLHRLTRCQSVAGGPHRDRLVAGQQGRTEQARPGDQHHPDEEAWVAPGGRPVADGPR